MNAVDRIFDRARTVIWLLVLISIVSHSIASYRQGREMLDRLKREENILLWIDGWEHLQQDSTHIAEQDSLKCRRR